MKMLITYGGTKEPIDKVRYIGNMSTGRTGETIAKYFIAKGDDVTCIKANSIQDLAQASNRNYFSFEDLQTALLEELHQTNYDVIIHAAAVSDYRVTSVSNNQDDAVAIGGKIRSGQKLQLVLEPTPKLITKIKDVSKNKKALLIGFKLTESASAQEKMDAVYKVFDNGASIVVHNDLNEMSENIHPCQIFTSTQANVKTNTKQELAEKLYSLVKERL